MSSCSGSGRSFHDEDERTPLNEEAQLLDFDSGSEISEAYSCQNTKQNSGNWTILFEPIARLVCGLGRLLTLLLPTLVMNLFKARNHNRQEEKLHPTAYLDGMRGLAAFAVFLCHLSYSTWDIGHTYGARVGDEGENLYLLQLPIVRLFYSGPPMVAIFFIISGYALSYKPLKQMRNRDFQGFVTTLTSAVFRRPFRLFLPCFASTFIVVCLTRLGLYKLTEEFANNMRAIHENHYWTAPDAWTQIGDWLHNMVNFVNVFDWSLYAGATDIDPHLWTIPVEYRCSMALFITQILVARMSSRLRLSTLAFLILWGTYWNRWEMVPFWAGIGIAELDLIKIAIYNLPMSEKSEAEVNPPNNGRSFWKKLANPVIFITGLYLASYPDADGHASPGYIQLTNMIPERYTEKHRFWPNIGAIMIVYSVGNLDFLKRIFTTRLLQYLGQISFPLYVCHGFVIHTFGYMMMDWVWEATDAWGDRSRFTKGYIFAATCTIAVTIWVSDIFLRVVDVRTVKFARWIENKAFKE